MSEVYDSPLYTEWVCTKRYRLRRQHWVTFYFNQSNSWQTVCVYTWQGRPAKTHHIPHCSYFESSVCRVTTVLVTCYIIYQHYCLPLLRFALYSKSYSYPFFTIDSVQGQCRSGYITLGRLYGTQVWQCGLCTTPRPPLIFVELMRPYV